MGRPGDWRYSKDYLPTDSVVYVNLFNNQWGTNFQQWIGGTWSSTVRVWPIRNQAEAGELAANSIEWRGEAIAALADGAAGTLPLSQPGMAVSRKGIQVTAFGANPDGDGIILRLWELAGQAGPVSVSWPPAWKTGRGSAVNLRGAPTGGITTDIRANAPLSILIEALQ